MKFSVRQLDEWYSAYYDPEKRELGKILRYVKGKDVLELGCGTGRVSFQILPYVKRLVCIDKNRQFISYCNEKRAMLQNAQKIKFLVMNIANLKFSCKFDVVLSTWAGLHYLKGKEKVVENIAKILRKNGKLVIIEAAYDSEFWQTLWLIAPREVKLRQKIDELKKELRKKFSVKESTIETYYKFPDIEKLIENFKIELEFEEGREFTKEMEETLRKYFRNQLTVGEKAIVLVCKPISFS